VARQAGSARARARNNREGGKSDPPLPDIGDSAPTFSAQASDGSTVRLGELLDGGPVVLIFYPGNNTPG
jgi:hypothetical protein